MKTSKTLLFAALAVVVAGILIARHSVVRAPRGQTGRGTQSPAVGGELRPPAKSLSLPTAPQTVPSAPVSNSSDVPRHAQAGKSAVPTNAQPPTTQSPFDQSLTYNGYAVQDPLARVALFFVGTGDQEADAYWESAIFDPSLPAEERKDLIEDLNETGMADPHDPGPADLPMILARIGLIEQLVPYSIDQVDANAFAEAYKDLSGLAIGQTPP